MVSHPYTIFAHPDATYFLSGASLRAINVSPDEIAGVGYAEPTPETDRFIRNYLETEYRDTRAVAPPLDPKQHATPTAYFALYLVSFEHLTRTRGYTIYDPDTEHIDLSEHALALVSERYEPLFNNWFTARPNLPSSYRCSPVFRGRESKRNIMTQKWRFYHKLCTLAEVASET